MFRRLINACIEAARTVKRMRRTDALLVGGHFTLAEYLELPIANAIRAYRK